MNNKYNTDTDSNNDISEEEYYEWIEKEVAMNSDFSKMLVPMKEKYKHGEISFETYKNFFGELYIQMFGKKIVNDFFYRERKKTAKKIGFFLSIVLFVIIVIYLMHW